MARKDLYASLDASADTIGVDKMKAQIAELQNKTPDRIDPKLLVRSPYQPRTSFPPDEMAELVESILSTGAVLVPVIARPGINQLIAGERRTLAAIELGIDLIPVHWHECTDVEAAEFAAFENVKRADLNPIDETNMVINMISLRLNLPDRQAAIDLIRSVRSAKSSDEKVFQNCAILENEMSVVESTIKEFTKGSLSVGTFASSKLKLLNLPSDISEAIQSDKISFTQASEIGKIINEEDRTKILDQVVEENLTTRQIKAAIADIQPKRKKQVETIPLKETTNENIFLEEGDDATNLLHPNGENTTPTKQLPLECETEVDEINHDTPDLSKSHSSEIEHNDSDESPNTNEAIDLDISEAITNIRYLFENEVIDTRTKIKAMKLLNQVISLIK